MFDKSPAQFADTYFAGKKMFVNSAMKNGTEVHKDIEVGVRGAKLIFEERETKATVDIQGVPMMFICDSHETGKFVDYKTGKKWTQEQVDIDTKQEYTALGVAKLTGAKSVEGSIEWVAPSDDHKKDEVFTVVYDAKRLKEIEARYKKTIKAINEAYEEWLTQSDVFVDARDVKAYSELINAKKNIDIQLDEVKARIAEAMDSGGLQKHKTDYGNFNFTSRAVYPPIPEKLAKAQTKAKAGVDKWKKETEPVEFTKTLAFRAI
ncbi:MAG: hypothetical protein KAT71_08205 [Gammaproteobacteria bacterium]|nr:hypothetical protein [Gammaproteobacteria bacterium]